MHFIFYEPIADGYRIASAWGSIISYLSSALNRVIYAYLCNAIGREIHKMVTKLLRRRSFAASATQQEIVGKKVNSTINSDDVKARHKENFTVETK